MRNRNSRFIVLTVVFCVFGFIQNTSAQNLTHSGGLNLIPNPSFENLDTSIRRMDMEMENFGVIKDWKVATSSPDVHHPDLDRISFLHKAPNFLKQFGDQKPRTGKGKVGMYIAGGVYKEGVTAKLKKTLTAGKFYYFHMYVSLGEGISNSCTSSIGSYFTARKPRISATSRLPLNIESSKVICDDKEWTKVCGVYRAKGTENYVSLGYFSDSPRGKAKDGGKYDAAYYYVDDAMLLEMRDTRDLSTAQICDMALDFSPLEFLVGESEVYPEIQKQLDSYIQYISIFNVKKVQIVGHADDSGSIFENEIMSAMRASNVKRYFVEKGIDESLLEVVAAGNTKPIVTAETEEDSDLDKESNNRIEIVIE